MRVTQNIINRNLLLGLHQAHEQLARMNRQLSTGQRINTVSDDVPGSRQVLQLERENGRLNVYLNNLQNVNSMLSVATSTLSDASQSMARIQELAVQAATGTYGNAERQAMAAGVDTLLETLLTTVNVEHRGAYVYSGEAKNTRPFEAVRNADGRITTVEYRGEATSTEVQVGPQHFTEANLVGKDLVQKNTDVFAVGAALRDAIAAGDLDEVRLQMDRLESCHTELRTSLGSLGERQNQLQMIRTMTESFRGLNDDVISEVRDADIAEVSVEFNSSLALLQTVLNVTAKSLQPNLANFL